MLIVWSLRAYLKKNGFCDLRRPKKTKKKTKKKLPSKKDQKKDQKKLPLTRPKKATILIIFFQNLFFARYPYFIKSTPLIVINILTSQSNLYANKKLKNDMT